MSQDSSSNRLLPESADANALRRKWQQQSGPVKAGITAVAVVVAVVFVVKILPALVAVMGIGVLLAVLFLPYWAPTIIAFVRKHPSKGGILALNFFFGWTFIGWVLSLVWSLSDNTAKGGGTHTVIVNTTVGATSMGPMPATPNGQHFQTVPPPPPQYKVGDVVNGHRFDGLAWVPLPEAASPAGIGTPELPDVG
jgi:hypothetical protein